MQTTELEQLYEAGPTGGCLRGDSIHECFEAQVERTPDAVCVVSESGQLTYRELNRRANQVAHYLQALGVGPEVLVGLCMERSLEMVVGLLAILKAGGAYLPLDPAYPQERLNFIMKDAQASMLLTQGRLRANLPAYSAEMVCLDAPWHSIAQQSDQNPISRAMAESLAYVLYTSGSTGKPKGAFGIHRAVLNALTWMWQTYPFTRQEVCCQKTSISFGDSIQELLGPLLQGIRIVLIPDEVLKDPQRFVQTLSAHRVTRILLVPSLLQALLNTYADLGDRLPSLKLWFASGEILPRELWKRFRECMPHNSLINIYGASEMSDDVTWYNTSLMCDESLSVPIGRPICNTQVHVLDHHLQSLPIGSPGELYVGGTGLVRGYLNRPELTAEKFIPHPFSDEPGARLYKTGDLARYLSDGNLDYLGRLDHQVKSRGVRMELGEIEAVLGQHPAVRQAVVLAREDTPGDTRLVAYVVPAREPAPTTSELRSFLKAKLPESMVPAAFVAREAFPLTPSGKVDRHALPQPDGSRPELESSYGAPQDAVERELTRLWEDLLGLKPIGVQDDFFELGGHSLLAVQLFARIEKQTGIRLPLVTLFERPTIAHLANCLRQQWEAAVGTLPVEIDREHSMCDRIRHPIARYLPSKYHPYVRRTYRHLKHSSLGRTLRGLYIRQGKKITRKFFSYTPVQLEHQLKIMGITAGDTLLMHSAFRLFNGFEGTPEQVMACVLNVIGEGGNLAMVSMPYGGSTAAYLRTGVPFDVRHTRSAMGVITEIFRQTPGVVRSVNPAHPILVWGPAAPWLITGHEHTRYSCGQGSPFEKLVHLQAKALMFDVSLGSMTFSHYLEDQHQDTLPVKLYEDIPMESIVIDTSGNTTVVQTYVFSRAAKRSRNSRNLRETLIKNKMINSQKIGNTKLIVLQLQQVVECVQQMVRAGKPLWEI